MSGVFLDWVTGVVRGIGSHDLFVILRQHLGEALAEVKASAGSKGYKYRLDLFFDREGGQRLPVGLIAWGGESQRGTVMFQIYGAGCSHVANWAAFQADLENLGARLTRVDVAVDFYDGSFSVADAEKVYKDGGFNAGGRKPGCSVAGDWLEETGKGRTFYVGGRKNGKLGRVYEKGKQLGDSESPWVRFEVELHNKDRVLPLDILTRPGDYMRGAYPVARRLLQGVASVIRCTRKAVKVTVNYLKHCCRLAYGRLFHYLQETGQSAEEILAELSRPGKPRRLLLE